MPADSRTFVLIGGGIIGCSTAYYLTAHPEFHSSKVYVLEASQHGVARGASGKAGGLVAKWAYPSALSALSFDEHVKLANTHSGKENWGWRFVQCGEWSGKGTLQSKPSDKRAGRRTGLPDDLDWVDPAQTDDYQAISSSEDDTAQVHPRLFTENMLKLAEKAGAEIIQGRATKILAENGSISGVEYVNATDKQVLHATDVIVTAGAWTPRIQPLVDVPIVGSRAHSITINPATPITAPHVFFSSITMPDGSTHTPEFYARPDGQVYVCGPTDSESLPLTVDDVEVVPKSCDAILKQAGSISKSLALGKVDAKQACYLPNVRHKSADGPIIGAIAGTRGLYIAAGHTCWGICNAPGTAKCIAELAFEGKISSANLSSLDPKYFLSSKERTF